MNKLTKASESVPITKMFVSDAMHASWASAIELIFVYVSVTYPERTIHPKGKGMLILEPLLLSE